MDEGHIDFCPLDPKRDAARFERMVQAVLSGALAPSAGAHPLLAGLVGWGRVAMASAALLAAAAWVPALLRSRGATSPAAQPSDPVALVSSWAEAGAIPSDEDPSQVLEGSHGR